MAKRQNGKPVSLEQVKEDLRTLIAAMKSVDGFRIREEVAEPVKQMASFLEVGRTDDAIEAGLDAIEAGRNILGAFLRHSAIDREVNGEMREGFFTREIGRRRDDEKYDEDVVAGLDAKRKALEEAVRTETGDCFDKRVEAYNTAKRALASADQEQERRDRVRSQQTYRNGKAKKEKADTEATALNRAHAENQRQVLLERRKQEADDIRNLL